MLKKQRQEGKEDEEEKVEGGKSYINECSAPKTFHFAINFSLLFSAVAAVRHSVVDFLRVLYGNDKILKWVFCCFKDSWIRSKLLFCNWNFTENLLTNFFLNFSRFSFLLFLLKIPLTLAGHPFLYFSLLPFPVFLFGVLLILRLHASQVLLQTFSLLYFVFLLKIRQRKREKKEKKDNKNVKSFPLKMKKNLSLKTSLFHNCGETPHGNRNLHGSSMPHCDSKKQKKFFCATFKSSPTSKKTCRRFPPFGLETENKIDKNAKKDNWICQHQPWTRDILTDHRKQTIARTIESRFAYQSSLPFASHLNEFERESLSCVCWQGKLKVEKIEV